MPWCKCGRQPTGVNSRLPLWILGDWIQIISVALQMLLSAEHWPRSFILKIHISYNSVLNIPTMTHFT